MPWCERLDRTAVAPVSGQPGYQQVDPPIDDVGDRGAAGQESAQQLLDAGSGVIDHGGRQLLFALRKVVIQRAGLDARFFENLAESRRGIALAAEQSGRGID